MSEDKPLRQLVCEELGINDALKNATDEILDLIRKDLSQIKPKQTSNPNVSFKESSINYNFGNLNIQINYRIYNLNDESLWSNDLKNHAFYNKQNKSITLIGHSIRGHLLVPFCEALQHEIEHLFHFNKMNVHQEKSISLYQTARLGLISTNRIEQCLGCIIYYSRKFEQQAYLNGAYKFFISALETNASLNRYIENVPHTKLGKAIETLINEMEYFKSIDKNLMSNAINQIYKKYDLNYNSFLKIGQKAIIKLKNQLNRAIVKAMQDNR